VRKFFSTITLLFVLVFARTAWPRQSDNVTPPETDHPADHSREKLSGQRVMQTFDFEERQQHYEDLPMFWTKVQDRDGFPHYSSGKLDNQHHRSGQYSFKLIPDGASVAFAYHPRRIKVKPGSDSLVSGYVHLENALNCRAQLFCQLTDRTGKKITGTYRTSELAQESQQEDNGWVRMEVHLPGLPDARYIQIGVQILQQKQWNRDDLPTDRIFKNNVNAVGWFDDISIYQIPRVILRSSKPGNVFNGAEVPEVQVIVEGVGELDYQVHMVIDNAWGHTIRDESWVLTGVEQQEKIESYPLPNLKAGIYRTTLEIYSAGKLITTRYLNFAKLSPLNAIAGIGGRDFGVLLMDDTAGDLQASFELAHLLNARLIKLPVWRRHPDSKGAILNEPDFDRKLIELQRQRMEIVATFDEIPYQIASKMDIDRDNLLDVFCQDRQLWQKEISYVLSRYIRQIPYWQIGPDNIRHRDTPSWDIRIRTGVDKLRTEFDKLIKDSVLTVPLSGMLEVSRQQLGTDYVSLTLSNAIGPSQIPAYLGDHRQQGLENIWVVLHPLDSELYNRSETLIDLAKRIAYAKKGNAQSIFIDHPWQQRSANGRNIIEPTETFLVFRTLADHLGSARYVGEFTVQDHIRALIFDHDGRGCLFVWNENFDPYGTEPATPVQIYLGENPVKFDLFGNTQPLTSRNGITNFTVGNWPVIISNIDTPIAVLRSSLRLAPTYIDASISRQKLQLHFDNPFNNVISGSLRFVLDERVNRNWSIEPSTINFILQPRQKFQEEISLKFPGNEVGGVKKLLAQFSIDADRNYRFKNPIPFEIRLEGIEVNIFTQKINQKDLLIQQVVTNESDQQITLRSFVDLPDQDHLERTIPRLQPAATATKSYLIRDADKWLGKIIRIGLYDPKGTKRINYHIEIN